MQLLPDTWNALSWSLPLACLAIVAFALTLWANWSTRVSPNVRTWTTVLKTAAIALLCLCLLEPMHRFSRPEPGANAIVLLADASQSLNVKDKDASETRAAKLAGQLTETNPWLIKLDEQFDLRRYRFDTRVASVTSFDDFTADGIGSSIADSLTTVAERLKDKPSAGIVLFTDGNSSEPLAELDDLDLSELPPVYPVVLGSDRPARDISIRNVETTQSNFESAPVTIKTELIAYGHEGETVKVELLGKDDESIEIQEVRRIQDNRPFAVRFQLKPEDRGVNVFRVRAYTGKPPQKATAVKVTPVPAINTKTPTETSTVNQNTVATESTSLASNTPQETSPEEATSKEATLANNERNVIVDRGRGPFRILYVAGRPNWEYKFLRRAIADDNELNLVGLLRVANKEPKFSFRSRRGESTNPLYRGFGNADDATAEQYDEPVMIRMDTKDETELRDGFPKDAKTLFAYDAIILDDLESKFFTQDQQTLISQFVTLRGGGLLMLGGMNSFASGGFDRTRIGEMLPVYLDSAAPFGEDIEFDLALTREGWIQPWMRLESTRTADEQRLANMPSFRTLNVSRSIKPGATVLANVSTTDGKLYPALAVQQFGKGRSAALLIGDLWRWKMRSPSENEDLYKSWRQTLRWLVSDVPRRVEVAISQKESDKSGIAIQAFDDEYAPQLNSSVELVVTTPSGKRIELAAEQDAKRAGQYVTNFVSREPGAYRVSAKVKTPEGNLVEERESGWVSEVAADEFQTLIPNRKWLEEIAAKTGGEVIELDNLESFANSFENRKVPQTVTRIEPWWHRWPIFLSAICLLIGEWGTRRMAGLA